MRDHIHEILMPHRRFTRWSIALSSEAVNKALDASKVAIGDIRGLIVNTCTGYLCPGISTYLIEELGLKREVKAYDLLGSGCGGAIPNLQLADALVRPVRRRGHRKRFGRNLQRYFPDGR